MVYACAPHRHLEPAPCPLHHIYIKQRFPQLHPWFSYFGKSQVAGLRGQAGP